MKLGLQQNLWKRTPLSLVGCNVYPGFEFDDFELGKRDNLLASYPEHSEMILRLTNN